MHPFIALQPPVRPVDALTRIAWLLERNREGTYRVEAFRRAAARVRATDPDDLTSRAAAGTLTELAGLGPSTATVITESLAGALPTYLARLQDDAPPFAVDASAVSQRGDLHSHTEWSDGGAPIAEMAAAARGLGLDWLAVTDHSPRLQVAHGLSAERLEQQIDAIDAYNTQCDNDFRLLRGIEVDILDDGSLDQSDALLDRLDVVTASVHSKLRMERTAMTDRMIAAVSDPRVNVLGHCTGRRVMTGRGHRPPSEFDARAVFEACRAHGTAVEINSRPERVDPPDDLLAVAVEIGCLVAVDSDAHAPGQLTFTALGSARAAEHGIDMDRVVTTWPVSRVLDWAGGVIAY